MSLVFALYRVHVLPSFLVCVLLLLPPGACMCSSITSNVFAIHRGRLSHSLATKIGANFLENRRVSTLPVCTASAKRLRGRRELDSELASAVVMFVVTRIFLSITSGRNERRHRRTGCHL